MTSEKIATSNPQKIFYPEDKVTKSEVVDYYRAVAKSMVPHLTGRPLTLRRFPNGIQQESWFQKEASDYLPDWIRVEKIPQRKSGQVRHVICQDEETLVYLANQAAIEFHIWTSTLDSLTRPNLIVLDLDPVPTTEITQLRKLARRVRDLYEEIGLTAYLQATGGRGFHVVAPLDTEADYEVVHTLARETADYLAVKDSERLTTEFRKDKRGNKIFLDAHRNGYAQTFIAPYSLRSRPGAAAATPLDWSELGKAAPNGWNYARVKQRLARKADPWRSIYDHPGSANEALEQLRRL
jgi:bifunctional non-homologous end joining protein LigD